MSILDGLLGQVAGNVDITNLAEKIGLPADKVEQAVHALGLAHPQPGDTVQTAAAQTGLPADKLQEIVGHIGGEGALAQFSSLLHSEGSLTDKLSGFASGLFGQ
jgi:hypothetical protein